MFNFQDVVKSENKRGIEHSFSFKVDKPIAEKPNKPKKKLYLKTPRIRKWKPLYDRIVIYHIAGMSYKEIGSRLDITPQVVSKVCRSPRAQKEFDASFDRGVAEIENHLSREVIRSKTKALGAIVRFQENKELETADPYKFVSTNLRILNSYDGAGIRRESSGPAVTNQQTNIFIAENMSKLMQALEKSSKPSGSPIQKNVDTTKKLSAFSNV